MKVKTMRQVCTVLAGTGLLVAAVGCVPKIYVIDRQTVLEDEAAGEWPEFEKKLISNVEEKTPTPTAKVRDSESRRRLYRVLSGDVVGRNAPEPAGNRKREKKE